MNIHAYLAPCRRSVAAAAAPAVALAHTAAPSNVAYLLRAAFVVMRSTLLRPAIGLNVAGVLAGQPLATQAQTCAAPEPLQLSSRNPIVSGATCGEEPAGLTLCDGNVVTTAPSHVFSVLVGAGADAVLTLNGDVAGFAPIMYLTSGAQACDAGPCLGGSASLSLAGVAPGEHGLVVTAAPFDMVGACGPFTLMLSGNLGTVDPVFGDGFD
jgi:hypothetical protein